MELTPQAFRDVQFREKLRGGYHPEDVDQFLEEAAVAAAELFDRLQSAEARAKEAERALEDASVNDETLKRVLLMAQRTADQAVREAREEAERMISEARAQVQVIVSEAEERGRRAFDSKLAETRANLEKAEEDLRNAQRDAEALSRWVDVNRVHVLEALREATAVVEKGGLIEEPPVAAPAQRAKVFAEEEGDLSQYRSGQYGTGEEPREVGAVGVNGPSGEGAEMSRSQGSGDTSQPAQREPHFLGDREGRSPDEPGAGGEGSSGNNSAEGSSVQNGEDTHPGEGGAPDSGSSLGTRPSRPEASDDETLAFDERALDSFFSEQEVEAERGSRFRRRG